MLQLKLEDMVKKMFSPQRSGQNVILIDVIQKSQKVFVQPHAKS